MLEVPLMWENSALFLVAHCSCALKFLWLVELLIHFKSLSCSCRQTLPHTRRKERKSSQNVLIKSNKTRQENRFSDFPLLILIKLLSEASDDDAH
jgi:hypothetical protein